MGSKDISVLSMGNVMKIDRKTAEIDRKKIEIFLILSLIVFFLILFFCTCFQSYLVKIHWIFCGFLCAQLFWIAIILYFVGIFRIKIREKTRDFGKILTYLYLFVLSTLASFFHIEIFLIPIGFQIIIEVHYSQSAKLRKEKTKHKGETN